MMTMVITMIIVHLLIPTAVLLVVVVFSLRNPFSYDRQHLSYDVCLEVRSEIIRTVLCCIVY